jgi:hypothetical protein
MALQIKLFYSFLSYLSIYLSVYLSMALQPFVVPWPLFKYLDLFTQAEELLRQGISTSQGRYLHTEQHKHRIHADRHPCSKWDSNQRPQVSRGRRRLDRAATVIGCTFHIRYIVSSSTPDDNNKGGKPYDVYFHFE